MPGDSSGLDGSRRTEAAGNQGAVRGAARSADDEWIIRNQLGRRNLTDAQRVQLALRLKPVVESKAKERQKEGASAKVPQKSEEAKEAVEQIAEAAGVSRDTVRKVEKVNAKATPELRAAMNSNAVTINTAGLTAWQAAGNDDAP